MISRDQNNPQDHEDRMSAQASFERWQDSEERKLEKAPPESYGPDAKEDE